MSVHISARAWSVKGLSFAEKLVLVRLADMANDDGVCWPSFGRLAVDLEIDVRSVRRIAARLEAKGLLTREKRFRKNGLQGSNWLTVLPPDDRRAADEPLPVSSRTGGSGSDPVVLPDPDRAVLPDPDRAVLPRGDRAVLPESSLNHQSEPSRAGAAVRLDPSSLTRFQRDRLLTGQPVVLGGVLVKPDAPDWAAFMLLVRAQAAEKLQMRPECEGRAI